MTNSNDLPDGGAPDLSEKLYYTIGEVSELTEVKPHVLRYWESEFSSLRPRKDRGGSRRYRRRDIEEIQNIKSLLYEEGYRIAGARQVLEQRRQPEAGKTGSKQLAMSFDQLDPAEQLDQVRQELAEVLALLRDDGAGGGGKPKRARKAKG